MQMRSAEEAQSSAMEQNAQPSMPRDAEFPTLPRDETDGPQADAGAAADQDTTIISAPDDPFASSDVTIQPDRAQGPVAREQAVPAPEYVAPAMPPRQAAIDPDATTTLTFSPNTAAGLSYLFLWISGVLIFFNERRNRYVRFHALQSILFGAVATVAGVVRSRRRGAVGGPRVGVACERSECVWLALCCA